MLVNTLKEILTRDLNKLKIEIESYQNDAAIWYVNKNITNSAGTLCLHLVGNLNTFIGAAYGNTGYVRNRDAEFSLRDVKRTELIAQIEAVIAVVDATFNLLSDEDLEKPALVAHFTEEKTTGFFFVHLNPHLTYHLGQVNYHRRLLDC